MSARRLTTITIVVVLAVLLAGIVAATTHHKGGGPRASVDLEPTSSSSSSTTRSTLATALPPILVPIPTTAPPRLASGPTTTTSPTNPTSTTVKPAFGAPEAAANTLWDAYIHGDRSAATRVATPPVIDALFSEPYDGNTGTIQGCRPQQPDVFDCQFVQQATGATYDMTAQKDSQTGNFKIVVLSADAPLPVPSGNYDRDVAPLTEAHIDNVTMDFQVR